MPWISLADEKQGYLIKQNDKKSHNASKGKDEVHRNDVHTAPGQGKTRFAGLLCFIMQHSTMNRYTSQRLCML